MSVCVRSTATGRLKIDLDNSFPACPEYAIQSASEINSSSSQEWLDVNDPAVGQLLAAVLSLLALVFVFKQVLNFINNR